MGKLDGQVGIVFGATSGIGESCAKEYSREGATVVLTGRREEKGAKVVAEITAEGGAAAFKTNDLRDIESGCKLIDEVVAEFGKLDFIHLNGGVGAGVPFGEVPEDNWDLIMDTNLKPYFFLTQHAIRALEETRGKVLYTCSLGAFKPTSSLSSLPYGISKAAVRYMTQQIAYLVADKGIRVNGIAPGLCETEIFGGREQVIEALAKTVPVKYVSKPEQQAKLAVFLLSDDAGYITGQTYLNCGGMGIA